jgi:hypothetical protein
MAQVTHRPGVHIRAPEIIPSPPPVPLVNAEPKAEDPAEAPASPPHQDDLDAFVAHHGDLLK